MTNRLLRKSVGELTDFLGFVSLCIPDMFPDDEDAELGPKNMEEAFEDLYAAVEYIKSNDVRVSARLESILPIISTAERHSNAREYKECIALLDKVRRSLSARDQDVAFDIKDLSPRQQEDFLLNDAIELARRLISQGGSHIPFAKVLSNGGDIETIVADDSEINDAEVLINALVEALNARDDFKAVAFATNVDYLESEGGDRIDAIMVDLDHREDRPTTCVLPYVLDAPGELTLGDLFVIEAKRRFFSREQKIRVAD